MNQKPRCLAGLFASTGDVGSQACVEIRLDLAMFKLIA